jgi:hypothetical protein
MGSLPLLILAAVLIGSLLISASLFLQLKAVKQIPQEIIPKWRLTSALMSFFLVAYLLFLIIQIKQIDFPLEILTASVFLGGGLFVLVITRITLRALQQVASREQELKETNQELERINYELVRAYDSTIAGWSHILDLRDQETEGHSQRVAGMTREIARVIGMEGKELVNLTRANIYGEDLNGDGVIGGQNPDEYGLEQLAVEIQDMIARENPPYSTVDRWYLFNLVRLEDGKWIFRKNASGKKGASY